MITKEESFKKISELVTRFEEQIVSYKKADYNETLTRRDFIDPFFKALGWDIDNENGYAESYREVIHEDRVKIGKATKAPDYSFRLVGGKRLFFVEAKKPNVAIKDEIQPAYQVRRYGWSAKLPISLITDFEELAIYDCTKKPAPTDKASVARIKYLTFKDYLKEFDFIWNTFSKEQVLKGSFDKFIIGNASKKGTATVDKEFLLSLDSWRTYLATSISWNNKDLDEDEINFVVQQTIDRIIFLRIAEDRSIEPCGSLSLTISKGEGTVYQNLLQLFYHADDKYNSGLFDFKKDKISKTLTVDNKVLKTIINELYYPESPYEFSVLSVEILGSAYEQFLGKQIKVDKAHRAHIEEKPEVRKAGGVYYTPQYVVEYIVKNTVGKLIENKKPKDITKIKIVDPACGSGSFLIGAYDYLLKFHQDYYLQNTAEAKKANAITPTGSLTTSLKKEILLNNIYGVDIDVNAVEVTKLSLLLKCMEGETEASINNQMRMFNERVLPTLDSNIKDGNSLIDLDFYDGQIDFGDEKKIKPFIWQKAFPQVFFKNEGVKFFDYVKIFQALINNDEEEEISKAKSKEKVIELLNSLGSEEKVDAFLTSKYQSEPEFYAMGKELLSDIVNPLRNVPLDKKILFEDYYPGLEILNYTDYVNTVLDFTKEYFDKDSNVFWLTLILKNEHLINDASIGNKIPLKDLYKAIIKRFLNDLQTHFDEYEEIYSINTKTEQGGFDCVIGNPPYRMMQPKDTDQVILNYFKNHYNVAEFKIDLFHLFFQNGLRLLKEKGLLGFIAPSSLLNNVYAENLRKWILNNALINRISLTREKVFPDADVYTAVYLLERNSNSKNISTHNIQTTTELELVKSNTEIKYNATNQKRFFSFEGTVWNILVNESNVGVIEKIKKGSSKLNAVAELNRGLITGDRDKYFSNTLKNNKYKPILAGGDVQRYKTNKVSEFVLFERPKSSGGCWDEAVHLAEHKILIRQIGFAPIATIIEKPIAVTGNIFTVRSRNLNYEKYLLAIINSKMIEYFWKTMFADFKNSFPQVSIFSLNSIPIKENPDTKIFKELILNVDQLLKLNEEKVDTKLQTKVSQLESKIDYCENRINEIVYQLYELTEDEIKIVEGK